MFFNLTKLKTNWQLSYSKHKLVIHLNYRRYDIHLKYCSRVHLTPKKLKTEWLDTYKYSILTNTQYLPILNTYQYSILTNTQYLPILNTFQYLILTNTRYLPVLNTYQYSILTNTGANTQYCTVYRWQLFSDTNIRCKWNKDKYIIL